MKDLLYYPGFEVQSHDWLKFAILYLDKLHPIIPKAGESHLSEAFSRVRNETDLISPHEPDHSEGRAATLDAIELVERMLRRPQDYATLLKEKDFTNSWRYKPNQTFTLFRAKFSHEWESFCLKERLASPSHEGIRVTKTLGQIYMSFLAHAISEARGQPPITDNEEMDQISIVTRKTSRSTKKSTAIAKSVIELALPRNISDIDIIKLIAHRNSIGFKERLHAFHEELEKHITAMEAGNATNTFLKSQGSTMSEFSDEIISLGAGVAEFSLGVWLLLSTPTSPMEYVAKITAGTVLTVNSTISIRNTWNNTKSKRLTRKYSGNLGKIE